MADAKDELEDEEAIVDEIDEEEDTDEEVGDGVLLLVAQHRQHEHEVGNYGDDHNHGEQHDPDPAAHRWGVLHGGRSARRSSNDMYVQRNAQICSVGRLRHEREVVAGQRSHDGKHQHAVMNLCKVLGGVW